MVGAGGCYGRFMVRALRWFGWGGLAIGVGSTVMALAMMQPNMPARVTMWGIAIVAAGRSLILGVAWWLVFMTLAHLRQEAETNRVRLDRLLRDSRGGDTLP